MTTNTTSTAFLLTLILSLAPVIEAQQRSDVPSPTLTVSRHFDHFDALRSDGARLVEFQTLRQVREYAARHGYRVVVRDGRKGRGRR
jgi:hypothetical protein